MSLIGSAARAVLHPVQFADHIGDAVWHEAASRVLGGATTDAEVYGNSWTKAELAAGRKKRR